MMLYDIPKVELDLDQQLIISRVIKEVSMEKNKDLKVALKNPAIQNILRNEFCMTDAEIRKIESHIINHCQKVIDQQSSSASYSTPQERHISNQILLKTTNVTKPKPLTSLQRKEFDRFLELDYSQFPAQPCLKSLYHISKIAQQQQIKILLPPTVIIGFNNDNRMLYTDQKTGCMVVQSGYVSPKIIAKFIDKHMVSELEKQSIPDKLIFPKYVIKLLSKSSNSNEIKLYYSRESMMADLMSYWGTYNLALQVYIKQKYMRPYIHRYYMKNNHVYKAVCINNADNMHKEGRFYKNMLNIIQEVHQKNQAINEKKMRGRSQNNGLSSGRRPGISIQSGIPQARIVESVLRRKHSLQKLVNSADSAALDLHGFPKSLDNFPLEALFSTYQTSVSADDLKKYFLVSTDNYENLTMMNVRPSANAQAEQMTIDLQRLYTQYYLQTKKFGEMSHFVCDFMENENGLIQLLQIKSFEFQDYSQQQVQQLQRPLTSSRRSLVQAAQAQAQGSPGDLNGTQELHSAAAVCNANILCSDERFIHLKELFEQTCVELDMWIFANRKGSMPKMSTKTINKYHKELLIGKDSFLLSSEKAKITPLFPLATFCDYQKEKSMLSLEHEDELPVEVTCCQHCFKVLDLFTQRYYSLVFKTETTVEELRKLKLKLYRNWGPENMRFLLSVYKDSKKVLSINTDIELHEKKVKLRKIIERAKTPESIMERQRAVGGGNLNQNSSHQLACQTSISIQRSAKKIQMTERSQSNSKLFKTRNHKNVIISSVDDLDSLAHSSPTRNIKSSRSTRSARSQRNIQLSILDNRLSHQPQPYYQQQPQQQQQFQNNKEHPLIGDTYNLLADAICRPQFTNKIANMSNYEFLYPESDPKYEQINDIKSQKQSKQDHNIQELRRLKHVYQLKLENQPPASSRNNFKMYKGTIGGGHSSSTIINPVAPPLYEKSSSTLSMLRQHQQKKESDSLTTDYFNNKRDLQQNSHKISVLLKQIKNKSKPPTQNIIVI